MQNSATVAKQNPLEDLIQVTLQRGHTQLLPGTDSILRTYCSIQKKINVKPRGNTVTVEFFHLNVKRKKKNQKISLVLNMHYHSKVLVWWDFLNVFEGSFFLCSTKPHLFDIYIYMRKSRDVNGKEIIKILPHLLIK